MPERVGLLSLPNELLATIFESPKFPVDYLCTLAVLCRRLHFLALPIYFARSGMPDPSKSAVIPLSKDGADMLAALSMALFLTSVEDLTCMFPHPSCTSIFPILPHLKRFNRFILRFSSVKRVTLQLDARNSMCNANGDDAALRAWSSTLGGLLNTLVDRRCTELTVRYGGYLTRSYTLSLAMRQPNCAKRALWVLKGLLGTRPSMVGKGWEFYRAPDQGQDRALPKGPKSASHCRLTALRIQSAVLVTPPCLNWTLTALRQCPITSLSFSQVSLDKGLWGPVFILIAKAAPSLAHVSLSELDSISDVEILDLCARLPRLTSLNIGNNEEAQGLPTRCTKGRIPQFRNLVTLIAPADFILYFLRARPGKCLPKLKSLSLFFPGKPHIRSIGTQLAAVCKALRARSPAPPPRICLSLALFSDTIDVDLAAFPSLSADTTKYFSHVTSLTLLIFPYNAAEVASWIRLFPSVDLVSFSLRPNAKTADVDANTRRFVEALFAGNSLIQSIVANGKTFNLTEKL